MRASVQQVSNKKEQKMAVTAEFILQGYAYSLEQCGVLLRDANLAYQNGSYATAVVLTRFAQEAFGQC